MQYPDSPEGVAFALLMLIVSGISSGEPAKRPEEAQILGLYRRCLAATRDPESIRQIMRMQDLGHH